MRPSQPALSVLFVVVLLLSDPGRPVANPTFTDATEQMGLAVVHSSASLYGPGISAVDFDLDGDLDLFIVDDQNGNRLYRNDGGVLVDIAPLLGLNWRPEENTVPGTPGAADVGSMMPYFVDIENDGDRDLFLTVWNLPNRFWRNEGDGTFTDVSDSMGLLEESGFSATASFGDYNRDGLLDVYVADWGQLDNLYRNSGGRRFTNVGTRTGIWDGVNPQRPGWGGVWFHFDNKDRDPELLVANDFGFPNFIYWNLGNGSFLENSHQWFADTQNGGASMGIAFGDFDRDGDEDIYVTNAENQVNDFYRRRPNRYENLMYTREPVVRNLKDLNIGWFCDWLDYDNDGWLDLFVVNGYIPTCRPELPEFPHECPLGTRRQPNGLWHNTGGLFENVSVGSGLNDKNYGRAAAVCDFDLDGDLDIFISNNNGPYRYFRNDTADTGNWITLRLTGVASNRDAIGATVFARVGDVVLRRTHFGSTGYLSQPSDEIYIGLGDAESIDELRVVWTRGVVDIFENVPVNLRLGFHENASEFRSEFPPPPTLNVFSGIQGPRLAMDIPENGNYQELLIHRARIGDWSGVIQTIPVTDTHMEWIDESAEDGVSYRYRVIAVAADLEMSSQAVELEFIASAPPATPMLGAGYPNPFNPNQVLPIDIPGSGTVQVKLAVYDVAGRRVRTIFDGARTAGSWKPVFNGRADDGTELPSGIYFARLEVDGFEAVGRKLTLLR